MDSKIFGDFLNSLTPEQKESLKNALTDEAPKKKAGRPKKKVEVVEEVMPAKEEFIMPTQKKKSKTVEVTPKAGDNIPKARQAARKTGYTTGPRPNEWLNDPAFSSSKADAKDDQKLWGDRRPTPRAAKRYTMVSSVCRGCGAVKEMNSALVQQSDNGRYEHICGNCIGRR